MIITGCQVEANDQDWLPVHLKSSQSRDFLKNYCFISAVDITEAFGELRGKTCTGITIFDTFAAGIQTAGRQSEARSATDFPERMAAGLKKEIVEVVNRLQLVVLTGLTVMKEDTVIPGSCIKPSAVGLRDVRDVLITMCI